MNNTILYLSFGSKKRQHIPFAQDKVIFGRDFSAACDIGLKEHFRGSGFVSKISRQHFAIEKTDYGFAIYDMGSTNGTQINKRPLTTTEPQILRHGDEIWLAQKSDLSIEVILEQDVAKTELVTHPNGLYWLDEEERFEINGSPLTLTPTEERVLKYLYDAHEQPCSRQKILTAVWPDDADINANRIDGIIAQLRKKLDAASLGAGDHIETVRFKGYRLIRSLS